MSKKKNFKLKEYTICVKCGNTSCQRREHTTLPKKTSFYFSEWDYCWQCKHLQHYEKFKVQK